MNIHQDPYMNFADMGPEEMGFLQQATGELSDDQKKYFYMVKGTAHHGASAYQQCGAGQLVMV